MHTSSTRIASITCLLIFLTSPVLAQDRDFSAGDVVGLYPGAVTNGASPPATFTAMRVIPESASIRYARGDAPFAVRAKRYARMLTRDYGSASYMPREAAALGVSTADLESIGLELAQIRRRENEDSLDTKRTECAPLLRGATMTQQEAMDAIARIDDDTARVDAISRAVLADIGKRYGDDLASRLEARIIEQGASIEFSKTVLVKAIAVTHDGDYLAWLRAQCNAL